MRIRWTEEADIPATIELMREAFWNVFAPGCSEHYLLRLLREDDCFIPDLDFVAELDGKIVGNICYSEAKLQLDSGLQRTVLCLGPIGVLPQYQGQGIGTALIEHTLPMTHELGYSAVLLYGDPAYYHRFGFKRAERSGIRTADNHYVDSLQIFVSERRGMRSGRFFDAPVFNINQTKAQAFDESFPYKERLSDLPSQERFLQLIATRRPYRV